MAGGEGGKAVIDAVLHAGQQAAVDRDAGQQRGHALAGRTDVMEGVGVGAVEVMLVDRMAVVDDQHAGDLLEAAIGDLGLDGLQAGGIEGRVGGHGGWPAVAAAGCAGGTG